MKHHTADTIRTFMLDHYMSQDKYFYASDFAVDMVSDTPKRIAFKVHAMYEPPPFNSTLLFALCDFFDTKHINDVNRWSNGGCETCDYGSDYGFELEVLP